MVSGSWGIGLILSTDAHLYVINSVFGSFGLQRVELNIISRAVVLKAVYWEPCRPLKIQVFGLSSDSLMQNLLGWSLSISVFNII